MSDETTWPNIRKAVTASGLIRASAVRELLADYDRIRTTPPTPPPAPNASANAVLEILENSAPEYILTPETFKP